MTQYSLYPGFVKIRYNFSNLEHTMTIPCEPVDGWEVGSEPELRINATTTIDLSGAVDALMTVLRPYFGSSTEFQSAEAWFFESEEGDPVWVYTYAISLVGTSATQSLAYSMQVMTFRTQLGNLFKLYLMEVGTTALTPFKNPAPFPAGAAKNIADYISGTTSWVKARDGSKPLAPLALLGKTSDAIRKIRLLL
jgi:hypothetical protein